MLYVIPPPASPAYISFPHVSCGAGSSARLTHPCPMALRRIPLIKGLTLHGLRHGLKVWMEDQIADVLKSERLGHDEAGIRGVYGHVGLAMRDELTTALQVRWEDLLRQRAALPLVSAVPLLNRYWPMSGQESALSAPGWFLGEKEVSPGTLVHYLCSVDQPSKST